MNKILSNKIFVSVLCFACVSHQQIVASSDASAGPDLASVSVEPDSAQDGPLVLISAMLSPSDAPVIKENFFEGGGSFEVFRHQAVERETDQQPHPDTPSNITPTCQMYRIDIYAPIIDEAKIDYIMSKISELPAEGLGTISIPPISGPIYRPNVPDRPKTPPHLVNRCIFRAPANASIGPGAFSDNHAIREFRLFPPSENAHAPSAPPTMGESAFSYCAYLQYAEIPDGTPSIGKSAFSSCRYLANVAIPGSVTRIEYNAFGGCKNFNMIIPDHVQDIEMAAFLGCNSLCTTLPSQLTHIGNGAFCSTGLDRVTIPANLKKINTMAFFGCKRLISVKMHNNRPIAESASTPQELTTPVSDIGVMAFANCNNLREVDIQSEVQWIGNSAFEGCTELLSVKFEEDSRLVSIGNEAFKGCKSLTLIDIPGSVRLISNSVFAHCDQLREVSIGDGSQLLFLGKNVFLGCNNRLNISIPGEISALFPPDRIATSIASLSVREVA